jgi:RNA polymerase sigma factor (sigma-70 family)
MGDVGRSEPIRGELEPWERDLVKAAAKAIRTNHRDDLESDLMIHLLRLKRQPPPRIRNWEAFLRTALRNKAKNWIRDQQHLEDPLLSVSRPVDEPGVDEGATLEDRLEGPEPDHVSQIAFAQFLEELDPELREAWEVLQWADGNQVKAAQRLGIHRNTLRRKVRQLHERLNRHGFGDRR